MTFRHLLTPFCHPLTAFVTFNPARDYPEVNRKQRKTVLFPLFSAVSRIPDSFAGRVEMWKTEENGVFDAVFSCFPVFSRVSVHFCRFRGRLRRGFELRKSMKIMIGFRVLDFTFDLSGL